MVGGGSITSQQRPRARELGITAGRLPTGAHNAITDVPGVLVGHVTVSEGRSTHTGGTAVLAHGGNLFQDKVPAAVVVGNGFGKLAGTTQVGELGEIETPVLLTNTSDASPAPCCHSPRAPAARADRRERTNARTSCPTCRRR